MRSGLFLLSALSALPSVIAEDASKQKWPTPSRGNATFSNFAFDSGEKLPKLELHYQTLGKLKVNPDGTSNAVLIMHGTTASSEQFLNDNFAAVLFNRGQALDPQKYFLVLPDGIGHGLSSKPSNTGLRGKFPKYQYSDMIRAYHRLLTEHLKVKRTRLTMGVSMGGMHTWMVGSLYPDFSDALMAISSLPIQTSGTNRLWRKFATGLIETDPAYKGGDYETQPITGLQGLLSLVQVMLASAADFQRRFPTREAVDKYVDGLIAHVPDYDANDQLFAWNASYTYDPEPHLKKIKAPLTAVNTADDLMNPDIGILENGVKKMQRGLGKAVIIPASNETYGHGTYIKAKLWTDELQKLLSRSQHKNGY